MYQVGIKIVNTSTEVHAVSKHCLNVKRYDIQTGQIEMLISHKNKVLQRQPYNKTKRSEVGESKSSDHRRPSPISRWPTT